MNTIYLTGKTTCIVARELVCYYKSMNGEFTKVNIPMVPYSTVYTQSVFST